MILVFPNDEKCSQCKRRKTVRTEKVFFFNTINIETNHSKYPYRPICVFTFKQNTAFLDHLQNVSKSLRIQMAPIEKGFSQLPFNRERVSRGLVWHMEDPANFYKSCFSCFPPILPFYFLFYGSVFPNILENPAESSRIPEEIFLNNILMIYR